MSCYADGASIKRVPFAAAIKADTTHQEDFVMPYVEDLKNIIDMDAIRTAGLKLGVDPLGGAAEAILGANQLHLSLGHPCREPNNRSYFLVHDCRS